MLIILIRWLSKVEPSEKKFETFKSNTLLRKGIERNLEIIGEASNRIRTADEKIIITNNKK